MHYFKHKPHFQPTGILRYCLLSMLLLLLCSGYIKAQPTAGNRPVEKRRISMIHLPVAITSILLIDSLEVPQILCRKCKEEKLRLFLPRGNGFSSYHLRIFNRWGEMMFETKRLDAYGAPDEPWDGTYKGKPVPGSDFVWKIEAAFPDGNEWPGIRDKKRNTYSKAGMLVVID
jgi:gliding motility-associated-like protein